MVNCMVCKLHLSKTDTHLHIHQISIWPNPEYQRHLIPYPNPKLCIEMQPGSDAHFQTWGKYRRAANKDEWDGDSVLYSLQHQILQTFQNMKNTNLRTGTK